MRPEPHRFILAHEYYGIRPDIVVLAKPLAGGLPLGAILMNEDVAQVMQVGNHGTTFGGGPLTCSVAQVVIDKISRPAFIAHVGSGRLSVAAAARVAVPQLRPNRSSRPWTDDRS